MEDYHPWNFVPLDINLDDFDTFTVNSQVNTPRFGFGSEASDNDENQLARVSARVASPASPDDVTGGNNVPDVSMPAPPLLGRKPKARTLREADWAPVKSRVLELLKDNTLTGVKELIRVELGFEATERQYKSALKKWNVAKKIQKQEMKAIVRKRQSRRVTEPDRRDQIFAVRGQLVPEEKIERFMKRNMIPADAVFSPPSGAETPADGVLDCWTPATHVSAARTPIQAVPSPVLSTTNHNMLQQTMALVHAPLNTRPLELIDQLENQSQQSHYEPPGTAVTESDEVQLRHRLATLEALHGAGSEATLNTLDDLFTVLFNQGRYSSAEVIARKSQDACTTLHGGDHARTGSSLVQLGILFAAQGNYPKSLSLLEEAAQSILHTVGVHSSSYLQVQSYLGMTYLQLGSTTEAIRRLRQTESTAIQVLGKAHSVTLSSQLSLLEALVAHGQFLEAEERATALQLALSTTSFGLWQKESSVNVTASLGMIYMKTFRLNEARQVLNLSWQQAEESLTKEHLTTLRILAYAAVACMESGQQEEALAKFDSCIGASERVLGLNHPFTQYVMGRRIFCYV